LVNFIIFDIGATSLSGFEGIPHLSYPIIKDEREGIYVLNFLVEEMERRIDLKVEQLLEEPAIVCVIDEFVSLISNINDKKLSENYKTALNNILRRGRKAKIHLILATQNPTAEEMKIDIGNATTRVAFKLASPQTAYSFIGDTGATKLPGKGAMLFRDSTSVTPVRMQGGYISKEDAMQLLSHIKDSNQDDSVVFRIPKYNHSKNVLNEAMESLPQKAENRDSEFVKIALWCLANNNVSSHKLQKTFSIGNRANRFIDRLTAMKIVSEKNSHLPRAVLPTSVEELSEEARMFFRANNIEDEAITEAIGKRS
jgi:S-DNA-T family DNA segregation ATPase FtsK/SpoIIIE